jgi:hypothetical protein
VESAVGNGGIPTPIKDNDVLFEQSLRLPWQLLGKIFFTCIRGASEKVQLMRKML